MMRRSLCAAILTFAFISCGTAPNQLDEDQAPRSRYSGQAGESPVGVIPEGVVRDTVRNQDVVFTVEYPTRPGTYPLIIFSHGFGATRVGYVGLSSHWTSQGYVVIKPAHADHGRAQRGDVETARRNQTAADWRNRARDIVAILDGLDAIETSYPELKGKIDRAKIGVGGHGYGAFTALLVGGAHTFPGDTSYADPRVKAIVAMSPPGTSDAFQLTSQSFRTINVPVLYMTGSEDRGASESETPDWRRQAFELSPAGDKWLVVLQGAHNGSFTGQMGAIPTTVTDRVSPIGEQGSNPATNPQAERPRPRESVAGLRYRNVFGNVKAISLAFWDAYLRTDEQQGRTTLENAAQRGGVELLKK